MGKLQERYMTFEDKTSLYTERIKSLFMNQMRISKRKYIKNT